MRHKRISRSPGATVLHAGDMDYGLTPAPDCRVPPANGSGRILWTRRFNEGWPAGCPLDDPSFAAFIADRFTVDDGDRHISCQSLGQPEMGETSPSLPVSPGGAFRVRRARGGGPNGRTPADRSCPQSHDM